MEGWAQIPGDVMPYIEQRKQFNLMIEYLQNELIMIPRDKRKGACNYVVSRIVAGVFPVDYHGISDMVGALRDAANEIDRRLMAPREDAAKKTNGDLPEFGG